MKSSRLAFALLAACLVPDLAVAAPANLVASKQDPALTLRIDPRLKGLRPLRFPIADVTNAERRIFVAADRNRTIERMVIVQFEKVRPGSDFRFVYPSKPPRRFGAETYRFGTFAYDDAKAAAGDRVKEAGRTRAFLEKAGYRPAQLYRVARLARVSDPKGLSEVIVFYVENADARPPTGAQDEDGDWILGPEEAAALTARMEAAVTVVKG